MSAGGGAGARGGTRRVPTPMPPPRESTQYPHAARSTPRFIGMERSYKLSPSEMEALNAVKATMPKIDRNGYFIHAASTAKKKKISLMQPRPPREASAEDRCARWPGSAQRVGPTRASSIGPAFAPPTQPADMSRTARLHSQLESYQPRYHTIRETPVADKKVHPQDCDGRPRGRKGKGDNGSPKHQAREYQSTSNFR